MHAATRVRKNGTPAYPKPANADRAADAEKIKSQVHATVAPPACNPTEGAIWTDIHSGCAFMVVRIEDQSPVRPATLWKVGKVCLDPNLIYPSTTHVALTIDMVGAP